MQDTKDTHTQTLQEDIAAAFSRNAASLLPEEDIVRTLEIENNRFENAGALHISPAKFTGGNTARHCKELLRRNQPLYPLYMLTSFLMEGFMILIICELLLKACHAVLPSDIVSAHTSPDLYAIITIAGVLCYKYISHEIWNRYLARRTDEPSLLYKHIRQLKCFAAILILLLCAAAGALVSMTDSAGSFQIKISDAFILYAVSAIFACLHNVIYDSHIISFLAVGADTLNPRKSPQQLQTAMHYINASLEQMTGTHTDNAPDRAVDEEKTPQPDADRLSAAKNALRARQLSFRIYAVLALIIVVILDALCIYQLIHVFSLSLLLFSLASLCATLVCVIVILSARTILKILDGEKQAV